MNKPAPKVTVVTICRNESARILQTAESVVAQTHPNLEWVIVDGLSTDGTLAILEEFRPKIAALKSEKGSGVYSAQNSGARLATGEFLYFLNGGDAFASPTAIADAAALSADADLIYGDLISIEPSGEEIELRAPDALDLDYLMRDTLWHPATMIRAELFRRVGPYDETYRIVSDYDFFLRALTHGRARARHCPRPIARFHADGLSSLPQNQDAVESERRRAQESCLSPMTVAWWEAQARLASDPAEQAARLARTCAVRAVSLAPGSARQWASRLVRAIRD